MPETMGNVLESVSIFRSGVGGIANRKSGVKKVGCHWPQLKHCMNRSVLNVLCCDFTSKKPQLGRGGKEEDPPGGMVTPSLAVIYEVEFSNVHVSLYKPVPYMLTLRTKFTN